MSGKTIEIGSKVDMFIVLSYVGRGNPYIHALAPCYMIIHILFYALMQEKIHCFPKLKVSQSSVKLVSHPKMTSLGKQIQTKNAP